MYAIEASGIAKEAEKVVAANDFSNKIIIMQEKVEVLFLFLLKKFFLCKSLKIVTFIEL